MKKYLKILMGIIGVLIVFIIALNIYFLKEKTNANTENKTNNIEQENNIVKITDGKIQNENLIDDFLNNKEKTNKTLEIAETTSGKTDKIKLEYISGETDNIDTQNGINDVITTKDYQISNAYYMLTINNEEVQKYDILNWQIKRGTKDTQTKLYFYTFADVPEFPIICTYNLDSSSYKNKLKLSYNQRKDMGIKKIADKNQYDNKDFSIYTFGGDVTITIEGDMVYSFEDALKQKIITSEDIIQQSKEDSKYGICEERNYLDGGSTEYGYEEYTILKCNTVTGTKDLFIGMRGEIINKCIKE